MSKKYIEPLQFILNIKYVTTDNFLTNNLGKSCTWENCFSIDPLHLGIEKQAGDKPQ